MASRLGDPTARMLGRITLNPIKHIDPVGTVMLPLVALVTPFLRVRGIAIGWAKPTPVTTRNFKNFMRDDILTTVAGPVSKCGHRIVLHTDIDRQQISLVGLLVRAWRWGRDRSGADGPEPVVFPLALIFYFGMLLNLFLATFKLLPLPPLDGSHIFRHMLPRALAAIYDRLGIILIIAFYFGGGAPLFTMHGRSRCYRAFLARLLAARSGRPGFPLYNT